MAFRDLRDTLADLQATGHLLEVQAPVSPRYEAAAILAVPDDLVDAVALCGPRARIADRLQLWKESPITHSTSTPTA